jgi:hypothetical protein
MKKPVIKKVGDITLRDFFLYCSDGCSTCQLYDVCDKISYNDSICTKLNKEFLEWEIVLKEQENE